MRAAPCRRSSPFAPLACLLALATACGSPEPRQPPELARAAALRPIAADDLFGSLGFDLFAPLAGGESWACARSAVPGRLGLVAGRPPRFRAVAPPAPGGGARWIVGFPGDARWLVAWRRESGIATQLYVREAAGNWRVLAESPDGLLDFLGFSPQGDRFRVAIDARRPGAADVVEFAGVGYARSELWRNDFGFLPAAVSAAGDTIALVHPVHPESDEIFLGARGSGELRLLLPDGADARFRPLAFSPDGTELFFSTEGAGGRIELQAMTLADRSRRTVASDPKCDVADWRPGPPEGGDAIVLDCSGRREAFRFERATGRRTALPAPRALRALTLQPAHGAAAPLWSVGGPTAPADWWTAGDAADEVRPLTWSLAPRLDPADLVESEAFTVPSSGFALPGEIWRPRGPRPTAGRPGLVWIDDDRETVGGFEFEPLAQAFAARGVVILRLRPRGFGGLGSAYRHAADGRRGEIEIADALAARAALLRDGEADPRRVAIYGEGAGGWVAALAASDPAAPFVAAAAIGTALDARPAIDATAPPPGPAREWWIARWGDPADARARSRWERLNLALLRTSTPTLVTPEPGDPAADLLLPLPLSPATDATPRVGGELPRSDLRAGERRAFEFLLARLAPNGQVPVLP